VQVRRICRDFATLASGTIFEDEYLLFAEERDQEYD
jgi:hypothetical protein